MYEWETTLSENAANFDRELNQGIALGSGAQVAVPIALSGSGGAVMLSDLAITTASGYDSSISITGNPTGFCTLMVTLSKLSQFTALTLYKCGICRGKAEDGIIQWFS